MNCNADRAREVGVFPIYALGRGRLGKLCQLTWKVSCADLTVFRRDDPTAVMPSKAAEGRETLVSCDTGKRVHTGSCRPGSRSTTVGRQCAAISKRARVQNTRRGWHLCSVVNAGLVCHAHARRGPSETPKTPRVGMRLATWRRSHMPTRENLRPFERLALAWAWHTNTVLR
jgi:hypothetical protein